MARYRLGSRIGSGGFGAVYRATRVEDGATVAIKKLVDAEEESKRRFIREVRLQMALGHKHVVPVVGSNLTTDPPQFVMPLADESLRDLLGRQHGEKLLWVVEQVCDGVSHAHENGVIHRDLKPENVLFYTDSSGNRYAAVADFGLGRQLDRDSTTITQTHQQLGTIAYGAPEQFTSPKDADQRADVYAIGKVLYEALTGDLPFPVLDYDKVPRRYDYVVRRACDNQPGRRYQTVGELLDDLRLVSQGDSLFTRPAEQFRHLLVDVLENSGEAEGALAEIARILVGNADDNTLIHELLPRVPEGILARLLQEQETNMLTVLERYDQYISGELPFEYCDTAANFYRRVFRNTSSHALRGLVLRRLPLMGARHHRWHVGHVFGELVAGLTDESLMLEVRAVLDDNPAAAAWNAEYLKGGVPPIISELIHREQE